MGFEALRKFLAVASATGACHVRQIAKIEAAMTPFAPIRARAEARKGGHDALQALLPPTPDRSN